MENIMRIVAVSTSARKGEKKINQPQVTLVANHGVEGDVHADGHPSSAQPAGHGRH